jgi:FKBP-type peptidyl-prolyl cis-trans isomerase SlyD
MIVGENKVVSMVYTLREHDATGPVIQEITEERPFVYMFGKVGLLPAFKDNLIGLHKGDAFKFILTRDEAYGMSSQENIIRLDKIIFEIDGKFDETMFKVGDFVPMEDEDGNPLTGKVLAIEDSKVLMDFNHPLAGLDLHFEGKILDVREPSEEELDHGHVHGPGSHEH